MVARELGNPLGNALALPKGNGTIKTLVSASNRNIVAGNAVSILLSGTISCCNPLLFKNRKAVIRVKDSTPTYRYYIYDYDDAGAISNEFISTASGTDTVNTTQGIYDRFQHQASDNEIISLSNNGVFCKYTLTGTTLTATLFNIPNTGSYTVGGGTWTSFKFVNTIIRGDIIFIYGIDNSGYLVCLKYDFNFTLIASIKTTTITMSNIDTTTLDVFVDDNFIVLHVINSPASATVSSTVYTVDDNHNRISTASSSISASGVTLTHAFSYYKNGLLGAFSVHTTNGMGQVYFNITSAGIVTSAMPAQTHVGSMQYAPLGTDAFPILSVLNVRKLFGINSGIDNYLPTNTNNDYTGKYLVPAITYAPQSTSSTITTFICQSDINWVIDKITPLRNRPIRNDAVSGLIDMSNTGYNQFPHIVGNFVSIGSTSVSNYVRFNIGAIV